MHPFFTGQQAEQVLDGMTHKEALMALAQTIRSVNFGAYNTHLTVEEMRDLQALPPRFPADKPVFAPYALSSNGYCQVKADKKRYVHRIACAWKNGEPPTPQHEASHVLTTTYPGSQRDFNPNNLVWETGETNKTRAFCKLYYLEKMAWYQAAFDSQENNQANAHTFAAKETQQVCSVVHQQGNCKFWDPQWPNPSSRVTTS